MSQPGRTNTLAVVSLVFGILGWTGLPLIGSIVAIITGNIARREIRQSGGMEEGEGLALTGLILGWIAIGLVLIMIALFFLVLFFGALANVLVLAR